MTDTDLTLLVRLSLGGILFAAGAAKLTDRAGFVQGVLDFGVLPAPLARLYGRCLPFLELAAAGLLLAGIAVPAAAALAVLLLASFVIAVGVALVRGQRIDCHCFGALSRGRVGYFTLARSVVLLGAVRHAPGAQQRITDTRASAARRRDGAHRRVVAVRRRRRGAPAGRPAPARGPAPSSRQLNAVNDEQPGLAVGITAPDFTLPQVGGGSITLDDLRGAPVLLGFVNPGCSPCTQLAQELDVLLNRAEPPHVLLVSTGDETANAAWSSSLGLRAPVLLWERGDMCAYQTRYTPFLVALDGAGVVRSVGLVSSRERVEQFLARV